MRRMRVLPVVGVAVRVGSAQPGRVAWSGFGIPGRASGSGVGGHL